MTQDKSTKRPWRIEIDGWDAIIIGGIDGEEGNVCGPSHGPDADDAALIVQAVNSHDAMQECVEALKACADDYDDLIEETLRSVCPTHDGKPIREEAEPEDLEVVVNMEALRDRARSALANLEKAKT